MCCCVVSHCESLCLYRLACGCSLNVSVGHVLLVELQQRVLSSLWCVKHHIGLACGASCKQEGSKVVSTGPRKRHCSAACSLPALHKQLFTGRSCCSCAAGSSSLDATPERGLKLM